MKAVTFYEGTWDILHALDWYNCKNQVVVLIFLWEGRPVQPNSIKTVQNSASLSSSCLSGLLVPYQPAGRQIFSGRKLLSVPKTRLKTGANRAFTVKASKPQNELCVEIRSAESLTSFKSHLKRYFHQRASLHFICLFILIFIGCLQHSPDILWYFELCNRIFVLILL